MRFEIHAGAWEEFCQAADRYESEAPGVGRRFRVEIERCLGLLAEHPDIGQLEGRRLRRFVIDDGFPYSLIYQVRTDFVRVFSIAHHSRRPGYWRSRTAPQVQDPSVARYSDPRSLDARLELVAEDVLSN